MPNCFAASIGPKTIMTWRWSMTVATLKRNCALAMTPTAISSSWICWLSTVTAPMMRSRWRSRLAGDCWLPVCTPAGVPSMPSTHSPRHATANATPLAAANPTPSTPSSWPTSYGPMPTCTGRCPPIPNSQRRSRCWHARSRTQCGTANRWPTSCVRTCGNTIQPLYWRSSIKPTAASLAPTHARFWRWRPHRHGPPSSLAASCGLHSNAPGAPVTSTPRSNASTWCFEPTTCISARKSKRRWANRR